MYFEKNTQFEEIKGLAELENNEEDTRVMQKRKKEENQPEFKDYVRKYWRKKEIQGQKENNKDTQQKGDNQEAEHEVSKGFG